MSFPIKGHAKEVVDRFKVMLDEATLDTISQDHFDELETLIEAALGVTRSQAQRDFAKELEGLAHRMRKESSSVD